MNFITFVIPCYKSAATLPEVVEEIGKAMAEDASYRYEIILVNDGSPDGTFNVIRQLCRDHDNITGISMARNFGQHAALMAGFREAVGDVVVCLDDDGQTPADQVFKLIRAVEQGADVAYARYEEKKHSLYRNLGSKVNSKMAQYLLDKPKDLYLSSYFAARRFVVDEMVRYENSYPYLYGLVLRSTRNIVNVDVRHRERERGESGYTVGKLLGLWVNGFTAFSVKPLRVATYTGMAVAVVGILVIVWVIYNKLTNPIAPLGWSSTIAVLLLLGGMILFVLGLIGEYIGRIYISINNAPQYVIREKIRRRGYGAAESEDSGGSRSFGGSETSDDEK